ncbi:MAG: hypothetical protein ACP5TO_08315, partial [Thermoplasmata archaeon]
MVKKQDILKIISFSLVILFMISNFSIIIYASSETRSNEFVNSKNIYENFESYILDKIDIYKKFNSINSSNEVFSYLYP